jgi:hypothetical protein
MGTNKIHPSNLARANEDESSTTSFSVDELSLEVIGARSEISNLARERV